jgi:hypothetical protein
VSRIRSNAPFHRTQPLRSQATNTNIATTHGAVTTDRQTRSLHAYRPTRAWAYQPARLQGSAYDQVRAGADDEPRLLEFLGRTSGETRGELRDLLRRLAREEVPRWLIRTSDEPAIACYAAHLDGQVLRVPLLRTAGSLPHRPVPSHGTCRGWVELIRATAQYDPTPTRSECRTTRPRRVRPLVGRASKCMASKPRVRRASANS